MVGKEVTSKALKSMGRVQMLVLTSLHTLNINARRFEFSMTVSYFEQIFVHLICDISQSD